MNNVAYKNNKKEINELINLILGNKHQIILYNSQIGYGNTSFLGRCQYILHKTESLQLLFAELSMQETNPLHCVIKNIIAKEGELYQKIQLFTDEALGISNVPLMVSIVKDMTQSDTLATLFDRNSAPPIYTGFYQDRLKEIFFQLINKITAEKRIILFIDNAQFIDNESIYELRTLLNNPQVTLVISKSGEGPYFDKFYYEVKYNYSEIEIQFPEPNIEYVKALGTIYNKSLSSSEADVLLYKSHKNIRKLLCFLREPNMNTNLDGLEQQILKIMYVYDDHIYEKDLLKICNNGPYRGMYDINLIKKILNKLEDINYVSSIIILENKEKKYKLLDYIPLIDIADKVTINKSLLLFYHEEKIINYYHLNQAWKIAYDLEEKTKLKDFSLKILQTALDFGYTVNDDVINVAKKFKDDNIQILIATFLFCNANYKQAKSILTNYALYTTNRSIKVMYAITLNRCRDHSLAEKNLNELISSSTNINELTILITFLISNHVHNNKISEARDIFSKYQQELQSSEKYAYFLRNSATIFEADRAYELRNTAKLLFRNSNDLFGYYTTIVNMASYLIDNTSIEHAISKVLMAFEGLQQYNASQIYLAANNLGICYLMSENYLQAIKYFELAIESAKTIMPIAYATINLSNLYLKMKNYSDAYICIQNLYEKVDTSALSRLKTRFYLQAAILEYIQNNFSQAQKACINAVKHSSSTVNNKIGTIIKKLQYQIDKEIPYQDSLLSEIYIPCYLEYWTINSVDILTEDILSIKTI